MNDVLRSPAEEPSWGGRLKGIESLRAVAALAVVATHVGGILTPTTIATLGPGSRAYGMLTHGLTLFFALSGFLLYRQYAAAVLGNKSAPTTRRFFTNRFLRIFPAYVVVLLVVSYGFGLARLPGAPPLVGEPAAGTLDIGALALSLTLVQNLVPATFHAGLGVAWSLTTELCFYAALPALALCSAALARRRLDARVVVVLPALAMLVVGLFGKVWLHFETRGLSAAAEYEYLWGSHWTAVISHSIFVQADLFAYGMFAACLAASVKSGHLTLERMRLVRPAAAIITLGAWSVAWKAGALGFEAETALMGFGCAALITFVALPNRVGAAGRLALVLEWPPLRWTGLISYSVYLWHVPVIWLIQREGWAVGDTRGGLAANLLIVVVVTLALSSLTYRFVERPALQRKQRSTSPASHRETTTAAGR